MTLVRAFVRAPAPLVLLSLLLSAACREPEPPPPPDVVLLVVDTLRADAVSAYGNPLPTTPHIDRLSRRGTTYANAQSAAPWTKPSVASLLTGLAPREHGVRRGLHRDSVGGRKVDVLAESFVTLPERLAEHSYRCLALQANPHCKGKEGFAQGFGEYRERYWTSGEALSREAVSLLAAPHAEPLFFMVQMLDPHTDYEPHPTAYAPTGLALIKLEELRRVDEMTDAEARALAARALPTYLSEATAADHGLGLIERAARTRPTLFIVTSDHGEEFFEHGGFEHGHSLYQELLHVPLLAAPTETPGRVENAAVSLTGLDGSIVARAMGRPWHVPAAALMASEALLYGPDQVSLWDGRYKLVAMLPDGTEPRLYDLRSDPGEHHPLAIDGPEGQRLRSALATYLDRKIEAMPLSTGVDDPDQLKALEDLGYLQK